MSIAEDLIEDQCYMWSIGEEPNLSVDQINRFRSDCYSPDLTLSFTGTKKTCICF